MSQNGNNYERWHAKAVHSNAAEPEMNILSLTKTFHKINQMISAVLSIFPWIKTYLSSSLGKRKNDNVLCFFLLLLQPQAAQNEPLISAFCLVTAAHQPASVRWRWWSVNNHWGNEREASYSVLFLVRRPHLPFMHTVAVVPSSDHFCTQTVLPSSDHYGIDTVAPSSGNYCIVIVVPRVIIAWPAQCRHLVTITTLRK